MMVRIPLLTLTFGLLFWAGHAYTLSDLDYLNDPTVTLKSVGIDTYKLELKNVSIDQYDLESLKKQSVLTKSFADDWNKKFHYLKATLTACQGLGINKPIELSLSNAQYDEVSNVLSFSTTPNTAVSKQQLENLGGKAITCATLQIYATSK